MFTVVKPVWLRYLQFHFISHHGSEPICALNDLLVFGKSAAQDLEDQLSDEALLSEAEDSADAAKEQAFTTNQANDVIEGQSGPRNSAGTWQDGAGSLTGSTSHEADDRNASGHLKADSSPFEQVPAEQQTSTDKIRVHQPGEHAVYLPDQVEAQSQLHCLRQWYAAMLAADPCRSVYQSTVSQA